MSDQEGYDDARIEQIRKTLRMVKVYTTRDGGVFINYARNDLDAFNALKETFGFAGGTSFKFNGEQAPFRDDDPDVWFDRSLPKHLYTIAKPIADEQDEARRAKEAA